MEGRVQQGAGHPQEKAEASAKRHGRLNTEDVRNAASAADCLEPVDVERWLNFCANEIDRLRMIINDYSRICQASSREIRRLSVSVGQSVVHDSTSANQGR